MHEGTKKGKPTEDPRKKYSALTHLIGTEQFLLGFQEIHLELVLSLCD